MQSSHTVHTFAFAKAQLTGLAWKPIDANHLYIHSTGAYKLSRSILRSEWTNVKLGGTHQYTYNTNTFEIITYVDVSRSINLLLYTRENFIEWSNNILVRLRLDNVGLGKPEFVLVL